MPTFIDRYEFPDTKVLRQTPKAILVEIPDCDEALWIPQSQVDDESEVWEEGQEGTLIISQWIAQEKGLA